MLQQWASGDFVSDFNPARQPPRHLEEVPIEEQPAMLDRASMEFCLADAFHPGCEMTWPMRAPTMYMGPFRIAHADKDWIEPSFGAELTPDTLSLRYGPTNGQLPGGITRWMAVPWQTDTASCLSGYQKTYDPYLPTFWPAHVPNQVLRHDDYKIIMDKGKPLAERLAAFANRASWIRPLGNKGYTDQINNMIRIFGDLGVVEHLPGPGDPQFPEYMEVENLPSHTVAHLKAMAKVEPTIVSSTGLGEEVDMDLSTIDKVHRFPHGLHKW
jgi:hypothetical protein